MNLRSFLDASGGRKFVTVNFLFLLATFIFYSQEDGVDMDFEQWSSFVESIYLYYVGSNVGSKVINGKKFPFIKRKKQTDTNTTIPRLPETVQN